MCLISTALAGARGAEHHRDLVVRKAEVEAVEDPRAAELLDDVDDLDRVLAAVVALPAGVPLVGVRSPTLDPGDHVVAVQGAELGSGLLVPAVVARIGGERWGRSRLGDRVRRLGCGGGRILLGGRSGSP